MDGSGTLDSSELRLDSMQKVDAIRAALTAAGVTDAEIHGELQPYESHHNSAPGSWAVRDCQKCHGEKSRFSEDFPLAGYVPGGVMPRMVADSTVHLSGTMAVTEDGRLVYRPDPTQAGFYLLGFERYSKVDVIGRWVLLLVLVGVVIHGGTRIFLASLARHPTSNGDLDS